jgi:putative hydrolase of the HAD superfamily
MKVARDNEDAMDFLSYMDGGLLSCDYNVIKPDPAFYQILIDKYDLVPSECVFLDDLEANLAGARELGIHTIRVKDHEQAAAELEKLLEDS